MISDYPWAYCTEPGLNINWDSLVQEDTSVTHTHTQKGTGNKLNWNQFQYVVNIHAANPTLAYSGKTFTLSIQLFRERLSDKSLTVHATTPKGLWVVSVLGCWSISGKSEKMPLYRRGSVGLMNLFFLIWLLKNHWSYFIALSD